MDSVSALISEAHLRRVEIVDLKYKDEISPKYRDAIGKFDLSYFVDLDVVPEVSSYFIDIQNENVIGKTDRCTVYKGFLTIFQKPVAVKVIHQVKLIFSILFIIIPNLFFILEITC